MNAIPEVYPSARNDHAVLNWDCETCFISPNSSNHHICMSNRPGSNGHLLNWTQIEFKLQIPTLTVFPLLPHGPPDGDPPTLNSDLVQSSLARSILHLYAGHAVLIGPQWPCAYSANDQGHESTFLHLCSTDYPLSRAKLSRIFFLKGVHSELTMFFLER